MNFSYREKSLWVSLLGMLIVVMYFSGNILALLAAKGDADRGVISALLLEVVIAAIIIEAGLHAVLAMDDQEGAGAPEDEREKLIRLKANELGYWVLSAGVIGCIVQQLISQRLVDVGFELSNGESFELMALGAIELKLVVVFWLSEIVRFAAQIYFYRKDS